MTLVGFSTGAISKGEYGGTVGLLCRHGIHAVEISVLREHEFAAFDAFMDAPGTSSILSRFSFVSFHAPKTIESVSEQQMTRNLAALACRQWPIVVHADIIKDVALWRSLGKRLCIENMDARKHTGRTVEELAPILEQLPDASLCFDLGHARQIDRTMARAEHVSEVDRTGKHLPMTRLTMMGIRRISCSVPSGLPIIIESPVPEALLHNEIARVREAMEWPASDSLVRGEMPRPGAMSGTVQCV
jgi:hypothetical protein